MRRFVGPRAAPVCLFGSGEARVAFRPLRTHLGPNGEGGVPLLVYFLRAVTGT